MVCSGDKWDLGVLERDRAFMYTIDKEFLRRSRRRVELVSSSSSLFSAWSVDGWTKVHGSSGRYSGVRG